MGALRCQAHEGPDYDIPNRPLGSALADHEGEEHSQKLNLHRTNVAAEDAVVIGIARAGHVEQVVGGRLAGRAQGDGIQQGDSGGGVFAENGALIGIISARNPNEARVVYFTHADAALALIARPGKL